jgi:choline dehydrogenase
LSVFETDYVVIGAGSSGCALTHRLSSDPSVRVLVLEAGVSGEGDPLVITPGRWVSLMGSRYDWNYATEPEPGLEQRRIAFPRGKAHGGSSVINAMAYIRGSRACFDRWLALGNPGWGFDDLLLLFARAERVLAVSDCLDPHAGHAAFLAAAVELGFHADARHDFNGPQPEGVAGFYRKNILIGRRQSAAAAYLVPTLARSNVEMCSPAQATRLVLERRRVVGVEYLHEGRLQHVRAAREVVVCAGAVDSPRLLMLSGIGAADDLRSRGIQVVADLRGVGGAFKTIRSCPSDGREGPRCPHPQ